MFHKSITTGTVLQSAPNSDMIQTYSHCGGLVGQGFAVGTSGIDSIEIPALNGRVSCVSSAGYTVLAKLELLTSEPDLHPQSIHFSHLLPTLHLVHTHSPCQLTTTPTSLPTHFGISTWLDIKRWQKMTVYGYSEQTQTVLTHIIIDSLQQSHHSLREHEVAALWCNTKYLYSTSP